MKKVLALVLSFALVFSTFGMAFADTTTTTPAAAPAISADAQVCADLGMLKGATGTVDAAYTATAPTRIQSAIMVLRLRGLEAEAYAFTGTDTFADANLVNWAEGKAALAYLKAHPELGFAGDGTNFKANDLITAQQYYKVMLESLGYKQTTSSLAGDFAWESTIAFAAEKGLTKAAAATNFTIADLAAATVETLKGAVKGGTTTLAATLVAAGKIDAAKATTAGVYTAAAATAAAKVSLVKAIGNTKVLVEFDAAVDKAFAENVASYTAVKKGTTTALEVKAAVLDGTKQVVLETAAQTSGTAYTMTVGDLTKNFAGVAKDAGAPAIDAVEGTDTETVVVTFTKAMDLATALDKANYAVVSTGSEGAVTVESIAWDDDEARTSVELTTKGMVANKNYKVTVTNVKSIDAVILKTANKTFMAKADKSVPKVDSITTANCTNTRVIVVFNEEIAKETAENIANYSLTVGSATATTTLEITAAKLVMDADEDDTTVELTTAAQKAGQKYVLHVNGIADTSVLANKMVKESTTTYYGKKADTSEPTATGANYLTNKIIEVVFNDASRLDAATALDPANYTITNDIAVEKVAFADTDYPDTTAGKTVRLTVSELGAKDSYKITVKNVTDEYSNVIDEKTFTRTFTDATVNKPASIESVKVTDENTIKVTFTKEIDEATAEDVANYVIDGDIGAPIKASLGGDDDVVTLQTEDLAANTSYKVTVNGVKDLAGNVIANVSGKAVRSADENDLDAPEIEEVEAVNENVVRVTFDEAINVGLVPTISIDTNDDNTAELTATYTISTDDDDKVLEFLIDGAGAFTSEADAEIISSTAKDIAGNKCAVSATNSSTFSATTEDAEKIELLSWEQTTVKEFKLQYAEKVKIKAGQGTIASGANVPYGLTVSIDSDDDTIVYLTSASVMDADETFLLDLSAQLQSYNLIDVAEDETTTKTELVTSMEDEENPFIEAVEAVNSTEVDITFNEDMATAGTYKLEYEDEDGDTQSITTANFTEAVDADDATLVTLTLTGGKKVSPKYTYTVSIVTQAQDVAYNKVDKDATFDFVGTDVIDVAQYITGVKVLNGSKIEVDTFANVDGTAATVAVTYGTPAVTVNTDAIEEIADTTTKTMTTTITALTGTDLNNDGDEVDAIDLNDDGDTTDTVNGIAEATAEADTDVTPFVFADDVTYTVTVTEGANTYTYEFEGVVTNDVTTEIDVHGAGAADDEYIFTYEDMATGDIVVLLDNATRLVDGACVVDADAKATLLTSTIAAAGAVVDIVIIRDGVVVFYYQGDDL